MGVGVVCVGGVWVVVCVCVCVGVCVGGGWVCVWRFRVYICPGMKQSTVPVQSAENTFLQ